MIKHYNNGYLAEPFNTSDLAEGINWVLNNSDLNNLSLNARSFIEKECTLNVQANRYISLYKSILKERKIK